MKQSGIGKSIVVFLTVFYLLSLILPVQISRASNGSWLEGWQYRKPLLINSTTGAGVGYQFNVTVHYGSGTDSAYDVYLEGKCQTGFGDIRFTDDDGVTLLSYWREYYNSSDKALFWFKVNDNLNTSSVTVYLYYGNPDAEYVGNVSSVFIRVIDGVVLALPMDEGSGNTVYDQSGNGNNGTIYGAGWVDGKYGKALSFDGDNDYVNMGNVPLWNLASTNHTFVAWFRVPSLPNDTYPRLLSRYTGGTPGAGYAIYMEEATGKIIATERADGGDNLFIKSSLSYIDEKWHFLIFTMNTSTRIGYLYIDNVLVGSDTYAGNLINYNDALYIGGRGTSNSWYGFIDELYMFNCALSQSETSDLYSNRGYVTTNYLGKVLVRKYVSPEPTLVSWGGEEELHVRNVFLSIVFSPSSSRTVLYNRSSSFNIGFSPSSLKTSQLNRTFLLAISLSANMSRQITFERNTTLHINTVVTLMTPTIFRREAGGGGGVTIIYYYYPPNIPQLDLGVSSIHVEGGWWKEEIYVPINIINKNTVGNDVVVNYDLYTEKNEKIITGKFTVFVSGMESMKHELILPMLKDGKYRLIINVKEPVSATSSLTIIVSTPFYYTLEFLIAVIMLTIAIMVIVFVKLKH